MGYQKLTTYNNRENPLDNLSPEELAKVPLNWKAKIPWSSKDDTVKAVLGRFYFFSENAIGRSNQMNPAILTYKYEWINYDQAALPGNKYNVLPVPILKMRKKELILLMSTKTELLLTEQSNVNLSIGKI